MQSDLPSPLHGAALLTVVGLFTQILSFFYRIVLSRLAGAEVMGLYQLIMPVYSVLLSLTAVGVTVAVSNLSAHHHALHDWGAVRKVLHRGIILFLALLLPLGMVLLLCSDAVSVYLLGDARTRLGILLLVPCVLLTGIENLHKHCFYGLGNVRPPAASESVEQIVRTAAVLGLLALFLPQNAERTVGLIVAGMIICEVFSVTTLILLFRRQDAQMDLGTHSAPVGFRDLLTIAVPVACTSLLGTLMGSANSVLIPRELVRGGMDASSALSAFGVLCGMTMPMLMLPTGLISALGLTMTPGLARQIARKDWNGIRATLDKTTRLVSLLMTPAMAILTVVGSDLGKALFKNPAAGDHMLPLAVGTLLSCWQSIFSSALNGIGKQRSAARNAILCDAVQLAFTVCTVAHWGVQGYIAGFLLSSLAGAALDLFSLCRASRMRPDWRAWFLSPALAALLMGLCCNLLFHWLTDHGMSHAMGCLAILPFGLILYLAALQAQGMELRSLLKRSSAAPSPPERRR